MPESIQVGVPAAIYGSSEYMLPIKMEHWVEQKGGKYSYCGSDRSGNGFTNGISNARYTFMIYTEHREDALEFKLRFPECSVHVGEQN